MALSLSCSCGARFEVEETFAGQAVSCPDCQQPLQAPSARPRPVRTSGFALASTVLALMLAFTGFGTVLAVLLGILGLISIARHRGEVAGAGYAIFGIVWGVIFTGLFAFAVSRGEIFTFAEGLRERFNSDKVDRSGPMEVRLPEKGFAITRPSSKWGVAKPKMLEELEAARCDLMLVNVGKDSYIAIQAEGLPGTLDELRESFLDRYREQFDPLDPLGKKQHSPHFSEATLLSSTHLPQAGGAERIELKFKVKMDQMRLTYLVYLIQPIDEPRVFIVQGWSLSRQFPRLETEIRRGLESFQLINGKE